MDNYTESEVDGLFRKNGSTIKAPKPDDHSYNMHHAKRGLAIIFNHKTFTLPECSRRDGTDFDRDALEKLLYYLNFDVYTYNDLSYTEICQILTTASNLDHSSSDCILIVVMSHGDSGRLYAKDAQYPTSMLWKRFSAISCPSLAGKPKLIFIQACRGSNIHPAVKVTYDVETDSSPTVATYSLPVMADILVMYSTTDGYYSFRDPTQGSYFIQAFVELLREHHETKDLLSILTFVNRKVAIDFASREPTYKGSIELKQMCSIVSMLTRLVYLRRNNRI